MLSMVFRSKITQRNFTDQVLNMLHHNSFWVQYHHHKFLNPLLLLGPVGLIWAPHLDMIGSDETWAPARLIFYFPDAARIGSIEGFFVLSLTRDRFRQSARTPDFRSPRSLFRICIEIFRNFFSWIQIGLVRKKWISISENQFRRKTSLLEKMTSSSPRWESTYTTLHLLLKLTRICFILFP